MSENKAKLFVISAPSGCGKGTILSEVFKDRDVYYSVSCTTRAPREGEKDGVQYFFKTKSEFEEMIENGELLEYARFVDNYYGTPRAAVENQLAQGRDVILEIETQGAFQVKKAMPDSVLMFILPPSVNEINRRLHKRGSETEDVISKRVKEASGEIAKAENYDYIIMNDGLEEAVEDFITVMNSVKNADGAADKFKADNENTKKMIKEVLDNA